MSNQRSAASAPLYRLAAQAAKTARPAQAAEIRAAAKVADTVIRLFVTDSDPDELTSQLEALEANPHLLPTITKPQPAKIAPQASVQRLQLAYLILILYSDFDSDADAVAAVNSFLRVFTTAAWPRESKLHMRLVVELQTIEAVLQHTLTGGSGGPLHKRMTNIVFDAATTLPTPAQEYYAATLETRAAQLEALLESGQLAGSSFPYRRLHEELCAHVRRIGAALCFDDDE